MEHTDRFDIVSICYISQMAISNETTATQTWNLTVAPSETVVAMTDGMQTDAVLAFGAVFLCTILCEHFGASSILDVGNARLK